MLNNGGISGGSGSSCSSSGMGTPDGTNGGMYGGSGASPAEYPPAPSSNPSFHPHYNPHQAHPHHRGHEGGPPGGHNGIMGHHSGGICSQMGLNQGACPQESKIRCCGGCGEAILDRVLFEALDKYWHHGCLKCMQCGLPLADMGSTCFSRDGMILCKSDYTRMYTPRNMCHGCSNRIPPNDLVMRVAMSHMGGPSMVFHVHCFTCSKCQRQLSPGDRYSVLNGGALYCEQDALKVLKQNGMGSPSNNNIAASNGPAAAPRKGKVGRPRRSRD